MSERSATGLLPESAAPIDLVLSKLDTLPTLAPIAVKLLQVTTDDSSSAADVVVLIEKDPSLTARLLAAANTVAAGARAKSVDQAVVLLGFDAVRSIVLTVKIFECFQSTGPEAVVEGFDRVGFWRHALGVACAARRLAREPLDLSVSPDDAYVAGLLHDLGKIAMSAVFPKAYDRVTAEADHLRGDVADCERSILGVDHTVVGRRLAERWKLPRSLQEVIWLHHISAEALPSSVESAPLIALVQLADTIAREQRIGYSGNHVIYEPSREALRRLGLPADQFETLIEGLVPEVTEQVNMLGLDRVTSDHMYVQALSDANTELGRLHTEMSDSHGRLTISSRYFSAMCELDARLDGTSDLRDVARAGAYAAAEALQLSSTLVFVQSEDAALIEVYEHPQSQRSAVTLQASPELTEWIQAASAAEDDIVTPLPETVARSLTKVLRDRRGDQAWLLPIIRSRECLGGIICFSKRDERRRLRDETTPLRSFTLSLGLAIETARAHAAARRLSEDLAGTNRRLQQAQAQLLRSRTLSMIAEMASGAAHELNGPLTVISGRAQILRDMLDDPEMQRSLDVIRAKAHECSRIVSELMDFARPRSPAPTDVELPDLVAEVREEFLSRSSFPPSSFVVSMSQRLPPARVDRAQIKTLLTELVSNAADAIEPHGGNIAINCRAQVSDEVVEVTVRDNGIGMTPTVLERAFDPFFSHQKAGRRRGFGLARAHRIVEAHGGRIWLDSRPNEGTVAHVILPAARGRVSHASVTSTK